MNKYYNSKLKASIAVEAAMIVPVFLIAFACLLSIEAMMIFHIKLQNALCEEARALALSCYNEQVEAISTVAFDTLNILDSNNPNYSIIENGKNGIDFNDSFLDAGEFIVIKASYNFTPIGGNLFSLFSIPLTQKCVIHTWSGYTNGFFDDFNTGGYVYVTSGSEVYHKNRECSHIKLSVSSISYDEIASARNEGGGKYYPCEICHATKSDSDLYITKEGTRYHNTVTCSGLKRTVRAIRLNEVGDKRPCKRCAN